MAEDGSKYTKDGRRAEDKACCVKFLELLSLALSEQLCFQLRAIPPSLP